MWLLNTKTAELEEFTGPDDRKLYDDGGYAILSHKWEEEEQSFQATQALRRSHPSTSSDDTPRTQAFAKIRECCKLAESHGYKWVWIDTCCINKESSAELSEAINSMFQWYSKAAICYAYLSDVQCDKLGPESQFYTSRWFTRGWTLQELIAPRQLLFVLRDWTILESRTYLVDHLKRITLIDADILLHQRDLGEVSIAQRMSWASGRQTKRIEDQAYCLMGLFGVNMPTIYGEGSAAFYRLQEEIMKVSPDHTIFAWGEWREFTDYRGWNLHLMGEHSTNLTNDSYLLASSAHEFEHPKGNDILESITLSDAVKIAERACLRMESAGLLHFDAMATYPDYAARPRNERRASEFVATSQGMRATLPVLKLEVPLTEGHVFNLHIAVLGCGDASTGVVVGLVLHPLPERSLSRGESALYTTKLDVHTESQSQELVLPQAGTVRLIKLRAHVRPERTDQVLGVPHASIAWTVVHILHRPLPYLQSIIPGVSSTLAQAGDPVCFLLSKWSVIELKRWGFRPEGDPPLHPCEFLATSRLGHLSRSLDITFLSDASQGEVFTVYSEKGSGRCKLQDGTSPDTHSHRFPVGVSFSIPSGSVNPASSERNEELTDNGNRDNNGIEGNRTKKFGNEARTVRLAFNMYREDGRLWGSSATHVYVCVVDVRLSGSVYRSLRDRERTTNMPHLETV